MGTLHPGQHPPVPPPARDLPPPPPSARRGPGAFIASSAALAGDRVVNSRDEELGHLAHVMIDVADGRIAYGVLACGGVLGLGEKLFAVPWQAFRIDAPRQCLMLDIERERLEQAPGFDKDHWPAMAQYDWARAVHGYFGLTPYWEPAARS